MYLDYTAEQHALRAQLRDYFAALARLGLSDADIETLAEQARFEEVAYLLIYGKLPNRTELAAYLEMKLSDSESARFEEHAADCAPCRKALALAMKLAVESGRLAFLAGRMPKRLYAAASSPLAGVVGR